MDKYSIVEMLTISLKGVANLVSVEALEQAVDIAGYETGWSLPATVPFKQYWYIKRAERAVIATMAYDTAHAFKFKQINLQQRFEHYHKALVQMDKDFALAKAEHPEEFVNTNDIAALISGFGAYYPPEFIASYSGGAV